MSRKKSASVAELEALHAATARYLKGRLEDSTRQSEDEDDFVLPLATGEVANIIAFLKHNNISAAPDAEEVSVLKQEFANDLEAQRIAKAEGLLRASDEDLERAAWLS